MDNLSKLEEIVKILDKDVPSTTEIVELFQNLLYAINELEEKLLKDAESNKSEIKELGKEAITQLQEEKENLIVRTNELLDEIKRTTVVDIDSLTIELKKEVEAVKKLIPTIPPPLTSEEVRDKLESLTGDERLDKSAIKGLEEEFASLRKSMTTSSRFVPSRRVFQPYRTDLTSQCDGSNKTFYLDKAPLDTATVMVFGTDFPIILRPTIDFTVANKTLTLATAIPAPSNGATLVATYFA